MQKETKQNQNLYCLRKKLLEKNETKKILKIMTIKKVLKQKEILLALSKVNSKSRKAIIQSASPQLIQAICEICFNLLNGNIAINEDSKNKLKKYKTTIRKLASQADSKKVNPLESKKKILGLHGGFLQILIPSVISAIASVVSSYISKSSEPLKSTETESVE